VGAVKTTVCSCGSTDEARPDITLPYRGHGPPSSLSTFDEQLGLTFTQNFTSIEYNVTVAEQTDPTLGGGPAYLLNGVSNMGYWYQVGVSWNWAPGSIPGTGFDMSYEVFDNSGNSVFPSNGQGGLQGFSGPVNPGDVVLLNLYFSSSTQSVVMLAQDAFTGASALESYSGVGATYFVGLPDSIADQNGYFTGLMTEWYHGLPYYANEAGVIYSNSAFSPSSAWMWMDEFNSQSFQSVFSANATSPADYAATTALQEFSYNGTTEYSDAHEFVTGALGNETEPTSLTVPLTLSFTVEGGPGAASLGYPTPEFLYFANGTVNTVALTQTPTTYKVDVGTEWSVSARLNGTISGERWEANQTTGGVAKSAQTLQIVYYAQYEVSFGFSVLGGGSGFSPPSVNYTSFGSPMTALANGTVWADAGSRYQFQSLLPGSAGSERWFGGSTGRIVSSRNVDAVYHRQFLVSFAITFKGTLIYPGLALKSASAGRPYNATIVTGNNSLWLDSGANYSVQQVYSLGTNDRLATNSSATGVVVAGLSVNLAYYHQLYVAINGSAVDGGSVSPESGWFNSGDRLILTAVPTVGWEFVGWQGSSKSIISPSNGSLVLTVGTGNSTTETALFYAGVTVHANGPLGVSYSDGPISGTISSGAIMIIYVPPSSTLVLKASGIPFLTSFNGWSGYVNSISDTVSLVAAGPTSVNSNSAYDAFGIGFIASLAAIFVFAALFLLRRRKQRNGTTERD